MFKPSTHVLLIHGLGRRSTSLRRVEASLRSDGYAVTSWNYPSRLHTLDALAQQLAAVFHTLALTASPVYCVTHSMGAIVLRRLLASTTLPQLQKTVMLAPPNNGSLLARRLLRNPIISQMLGPAAWELADGVRLNATCAIPDMPIMVIAGTNARDLRNPASLLSRKVLHEPNDGTVTVRETQLPRMDRFVEVAACHTWIMNHPLTLHSISTFLNAETSN